MGTDPYRPELPPLTSPPCELPADDDAACEAMTEAELWAYLETLPGSWAWGG